MSLTKDEIKKEILKCGKDPSYFLDNYAKIIHQEHSWSAVADMIITRFNEFEKNITPK